MPLRRSARTASEARARRRPRSRSVIRASALATWRFRRVISEANNVARGHRGVAVGFEIGDRLRRLAGEILPAAVERGGGAQFEIGDAGIGGVETAAFLLILGDRQRQRPLGTLDGGGRIAHLLVEDKKRRTVFDFLPADSHAAPENRQNSFEHWSLPACYEHCS